MIQRVKAIIRNYVVCMKMFSEGLLPSSAVLAGVLISFPDLIADTLPFGPPEVRRASSPIKMFIAAIFLAFEYAPALSRAETILTFQTEFALRQAYRSSASFAVHTRYAMVKRWMSLAFISFFKVGRIARKRASSSNFGLSSIGNKFLPAYLTRQFSHIFIIPIDISYINAQEYRLRRKK